MTDYLRLAQQQAEQQAALDEPLPLQPKDEANPYLDLAQGLASREQERARFLIDFALKADPVRAAEIQRLKNTTGIPPDMIERNFEEVRRREALSAINLVQIAKDSPVLARQLQDPNFTTVAVDDIGLLHDLGRIVQDTGVAALSGAIRLPQAFVGIADIATLGQAGKALESIGYRPNEALDILNEFYSEGTQRALSRVQNADGFFNTLATALRNPSTVATAVIESLPLMLGGAAFARLITGVYGSVSPLLGAATGEGLMAAGAMAEDLRGDTADGELNLRQALGSAAAGFGTAILGAAGGRIASRLGLNDIDTALASGDLTGTATPGFAKQVLGQGISEGVFEELPQSVQEQMWQNFANERPLFEGVANAAAMGTLAGSVTGAGFGAYSTAVAKIVGSAAQQADQIERADRDAKRLADALRIAQDSKLRERSPEQFRQLISQMTSDANLYVDGEVLAQLPPEVQSQLPATVQEQIQQAAAIGDVVMISQADALTVAPGTELEQVLVENARTSPDAMSAVEAQQAAEQAQVFLQQEAERVIAQAQDQEALRASSEAVRTSIVDQLNAAGRYRPQINEAMSQWAAAFYTAYGSRLGMTPEEFYQRYPLRVLGAPVGQQTGVLNDGDFFNQEGRLMGINVRSDTAAGLPYADAIVDGMKLYETRDKDSLRPYVGQRVAIVRTGEGQAKAIGEVTIGEPILVDEVRFRELQDQHLVPPGSRFDIAPGGQKYLYPMQDAVRYDAERDVGAGIVSRQVLNQAAVERLQMVAERGVRATASRSIISAEERAAIQGSAAEINMSVAELETIVRNHKLAHPVAQGWEPLVYVRSVLKDGKALHQYQKSPYTFSTGADGKTIEPGTANYTRRVNAVARSMVDEVRTVFRRATNGDRNAQNILAQAGWYKAMRSRLRREFGGLGDLFADLLGATSPNTPVRDNWFNAVDALRRASRGDFDGLILQWETWADNLDALETDLRAWFNDRLAEGLSKKAIKDLPEYQTKLRAVRAAREIPENLLPTKESGAKYGFNGKNVIRAMVDLWRIVKNADPDIARGGTAPKALNFSGNLIGFRSRATIDVWAARMLQRLAGGRRIASMAETGVSGDMREDATTTLQFGFGQDVFSNAARAIRNDPELQADAVLAEINDDDLQAVVWFVEKEIWTVNNWTSAAGEGGSFELEANLTGTSQQNRVKELRTIIDASPPTADVTAASQDTTAALTAIEEHERKYADEIEELRKLTTGEIAPYKGSKKRMTDLGKLVRPPAEATRLLGSVDRAKGRLEAFNARKVAAKAELAALEREVDRFVGGLSIQMSQETQGIDFVPTDADMARLAEDIRLSVYETDDGNTVLASKALSTEGRYGGVERSLDLEVVAREGYNANALWLQMLRQAQGARQDSTFLSRVLRANEQYDPLTHRPGVEIYLRSAASQSQLEKVLGDLAKEGVEFLTVIVDGRRLANTMAGQMPAAVGVRLQYVPEFEQRYGMDDLSGLDDVALAARIEEKAAELRAIADRVSDAVEGVSFAGQFWYETQVAFSSQYEEKINALTAGVTEEGAAGAPGRQQWAGDSVRSGLEGADRQSRETAGGEPGGDVLGGDAQRPGVLEQQPLAQGPRGTFNPQTLELVLNPNADLSTWFHETGHFFLEVLADVSSQPDAPAQIVEDYTKVLNWFGVTPEQWAGFSLDQKRPYHERWAESIEQYVMEGKAPSVELQPLMRRFAAWLKNVYGSIKQFLASKPDSEQTQLNDDIRRVMDRMLATDEQIQQANAVAGLMPDEQADGEAMERLQRRSMADLKWAVNARDKAIRKLQREAREIEKQVRVEVAAEVDAAPEMRAKAALQQLRKEKNTNDLTKAAVADAFGYSSVEAMNAAIEAFGKRADVINARTEQRMMSEYGDLIDERAIQEAANEAVHNEARARSLATELRTQQEMINQRVDTGRRNVRGGRITVSALLEAGRQFGANVVSKTPIGQLRAIAWKHTSAERRAGTRWRDATMKGDTTAAVQAQRDRFLNNAAAKAAVDAQAEVRKFLEFFKRVNRGNNEKVVERGRDPDVVNAARAILSAYGMQSAASKNAAAYLELVKKNDPEVYATIEPIVQQAMASSKPIDQLTFDELVGLHESIQALWYLSKRSRQMEVDGKLVDIDSAAEELFARMDEIGIPDRIPGEGMAVTKEEERGLFLKQGIAFLRRVEQWAEGMDGQYGGPFLRLIFQPIKDAADRYRKDRLDFRKKFQALVDTLAPIVGDSVIEAPELLYTFGTPGSTAGTAMNEILHAIAHTGNESNKRKLLLGRGWATENEDGTLDTSRWDAFVQRLINEGKLVKEHFDFVQGVWDLLEETKPLAQKAHRDAFGRYFNEVTANEFVDPFGVSRRGGYIPAQVDSRLVKDNALRRLAEEENQSMAFAFPQPAKGFTMSRVEYNRPLMLDLRSLSQHIDKVLLFSHMTVPARDVRKLLMRNTVSQPLTRLQPVALESMLQPWLQRSAQQIVETPIVGTGRWARLPGIIRSRAGMALMFGNVSNAIQQITGLSTAAVRVKPTFLMRSLSQYVANPREFSREVWAASPYMDDRAKNEISILNEQMEAILIQPTALERMQDWSMRHAYFLQTALDNVLSPIIWNGAFNQALADGMSDKDAVRFADSTVRQTQGSTLPEDVSRIETGPAYARAFTQFVGYFNMMANTNATAFKQLIGEVGLKKGAGKALYIVMMGLLAPIWVAEAIALAMRGGAEDDDDDGYLDDWLAEVFGMGTAKGLLAQIPIAGQFGVAAANRFNDNPLDDRVSLSPAISLLESAVGAPQSVYKAIVEDGSSQKAIRDVATLVSVATGVPLYGVSRPIGYTAGVIEGRIEPQGPIDVMRGLVTGTASPESKAQ